MGAIGFGYAAAAALILAAGAVQFARARLTGDPRLAWSATALLVTGPALLLADASSGTTAAGALPSPAGRLILLVPALSVLLVGTRPARARRAPRVLRTVAAMVLAEAAAATALALAPAPAGLGLDHLVLSCAWACCAAVATGLWLLAALRLTGQTITTARPYGDRRALALVLMAGGEVLYAAAVAGVPAVGALSAALQVAAGALVLAVAAAGLRTTFVANGNRTLRLADELSAARNRIAELEDEQRERLHDARTAVVGVLGATRLFTAPAARGSGTAAQLERVVSAEMVRLTNLLDPEAQEPLSEFALAAAFEPVLVSCRAVGTALQVDLRGLRAYGRPATTATVLANLLGNAAKYAPGSPVAVRASSAGATVRICIEDSGPGIPAEERQQVLLRGARTSTGRAGGTGLGLYTSALAMADQGGALRIEARDGLPGTRVVLSMPAARTLPVSPLRAG